jgi:acetyl-CoA acetyltransferase
LWEQAAILEIGAAEVGWRKPINPSGGLLSKGKPLGQ